MNHRVNQAEAVVFFKEGMIAKTLMFSQFNTMLEQQKLFHGFSKRSVQAAFIKFNASFTLTTAVLFYIDFDVNSRIKSGWNIPLRHLADTAAIGPNLGDPQDIKLSCASQCSVHWHQRELWDAEGDTNHPDHPLQKIRHWLKTAPPVADFAEPLAQSEDLKGIFELSNDSLSSLLQDSSTTLSHTQPHSLPQPTTAPVQPPTPPSPQDKHANNNDRQQLIKAMKIIKQQQQRIGQREQQLKSTVTQLKALKEQHAKELNQQALLIEKLKRLLHQERNRGVNVMVGASINEQTTESALG